MPVQLNALARLVAASTFSVFWVQIYYYYYTHSSAVESVNLCGSGCLQWLLMIEHETDLSMFCITENDAPQNVVRPVQMLLAQLSQTG